LANIDKVEGTAADKKRLTEDAHMVRAYEYFLMTILYCLPYSEENRIQMGIPLKQTLDYGEDVKRKTLGETIDFIKAELDLALQTSEERVKSQVWRVSKPAALAFAARFYLYLHDYAKALYYADEALKLHSMLLNYE